LLERDRRIELLTLDWKSKVIPFYESRNSTGALDRIRTGVLAVKGRCPGPLDDESKTMVENTGIEPVVP